MDDLNIPPTALLPKLEPRGIVPGIRAFRCRRDQYHHRFIELPKFAEAIEDLVGQLAPTAHQESPARIEARVAWLWIDRFDGLLTVGTQGPEPQSRSHREDLSAMNKTLVHLAYGFALRAFSITATIC